MTTNANQYETSRSPQILSVGFYLMMTAIAAALCSACSTPKPGNANRVDAIPAERQSLDQQIDTFQGKLVQRQGELQPVREELDDPLPAVPTGEPSRLAGIVLGLYSGPIDLDGDATFDALRVYVRPIDQRSRQIAATGTARVRLIASSIDGEPTIILDQTYSPDTFQAGFRSDIAGTHYALKADLPKDLPATATMQVTLIDATTGKVYRSQKQISFAENAEKQRDQ